MQLRAATLKLMLWFRSECIKMEEDEGVFHTVTQLNPTKVFLFPGRAGETVSSHKLNTNTPVHPKNTDFFFSWKQTSTDLQKTNHRALHLLA